MSEALVSYDSRIDRVGSDHEVDLGLDPYPHGGSISTAEALRMGVPVVALAGATIASRITPSILTVLQMPEWIARSEEDYVRIAIEAARDLTRLARLRGELRTRLAASALGDVQGYTREAEAAFRSMWRRWCAVVPAATIEHVSSR